jgi:hypothetical protein
MKAAKQIQSNTKKDKINGTDGKGLTTVKITKRKTVKGQSGNPQYLQLVTWAIETRIKLLNLIKKDEDDIKAGKGMFVPDWNILSQGRPTVFIDPADIRIAELEKVETVGNTENSNTENSNTDEGNNE